MKGEDITVYTKNRFLVIESKIIKIREIISYDDIEAIIIMHVNTTYENEILLFLSNPIKYENIGKHFFHIITYNIFLLFHKNKNLIEISYSNSDLLLILNEVKSNLSNINVPASLDKSLFWNEISDNYSLSQVRLVFSKLNLSLSEVLKKYKKIHKNE